MVRIALLCALALLLPAASAAAAPSLGDRTLRVGDRGADVRELQRTLGRLGHTTGIDGVFGPATRRAVLAYRRAERLRRDGRVTRPLARRMLRQLRSSASRPGTFGSRPLRQGDRGRDVRVLQAWLTRLGYATAVDGRFGTGTVRSMRAFQSDERLRVTGRLTVGQAARMRRYVEGGEARRVQPSSSSHVFPVRGDHDLGGAGARFGASRGTRDHMGQDVFAPCGTPLVAARGGRVVANRSHSAAGWYLVISASDYDYAYMHLQARSPRREGESVATGASIGRVGETGNAVGCHLHFELWTKPGWYAGGRAIDPLPHMQRWKRNEGAPAPAPPPPGQSAPAETPDPGPTGGAAAPTTRDSTT